MISSTVSVASRIVAAYFHVLSLDMGLLSLRQTSTIAIALIVGACAACSATAPPLHPEDPAERQEVPDENIDWAINSAITLYRDRGQGEFKDICSGVRVSPTRFVTAYHCVLAAALPEVMLEIVRTIDPLMRNTEYDGLKDATYYYTWRHMDLQRPARLVDYDMAHDLAILSTEFSNQPHARIRDTRANVGEDIFAIGDPLGNNYSFTRGYVSYSCRTEDDDPNVCWTQADITIGPGSSGGGLYDAAGQLMGLTSHGYLSIGLAFFAEPKAVAKLIEANK